MSLYRCWLGTALLLAVLAPSMADAADALVAGRRLNLRDTTLAYATKTTAIPLPVLGSGDDPTLVGASFTILNPTSGESFTFVLPAARWAVGAEAKQFRYVDKNLEAGSIEFAVVRNKKRGVLRVTGAMSGISLDEPTQGSLGTIFQMGALRYCALFGGDVRDDEPGRFRALKADAPATCPGGSPSGAFVDPISAGSR